MRMLKVTIAAAVISLAMSATAWAGGAINLPMSGQTTCYDNYGGIIDCKGSGQNGETLTGTPWPEPRFTVAGACVTDNLTGLTWARDANMAGAPMKWEDAFKYVAKLNKDGGLCGYTDWRVPNIVELGLLPNKEKADSAAWLNRQGFENVQGYNYWSSTTRANHLEHAWRVQMNYGYWLGSSKMVNAFVWPVRGNSAD